MTYLTLSYSENSTRRNFQVYFQDRKSISVNSDYIVQLFSQLTPLTSVFFDVKERRIQLFKTFHQNLLGIVIDQENTIQIISDKKIFNALNLKESSEILIKRLENVSVRKWGLLFDIHLLTITIWPHLEAAGRTPIKHNQFKDKTFKDTVTQINQKLSRMRSDGFNYEHNHAAQREAKDLPIFDKNGKIKLKEDGTRFNHVKDVDQTRKQAINIIRSIDNRLKHGDFNAEEILELLELRKELAQAIRSSEKYAPLVKNHHLTKEPAQKQFQETLQKTGLTKSYNSSNPGNPVASNGKGGGEIGGVGCSGELIEGLFDSPESLFETAHSFFIPEFQGDGIPFTYQELCQILHELAHGIYVHGTVPFFSLHFNQNAELYPVIHPVYAKTLVGQVISMLDYFMKGYLNGGVFTESFVKEWQKNPKRIDFDPTIIHDKMVNFHDTPNYHSVREILITKKDLLDQLDERIVDAVQSLFDESTENTIFSDYTKFTNSFRIIAKQKGFHKTDNLFTLQPDFDVFYTIEPHPDYKLALEKHREIHGTFPEGYQKLIQAYEEIKERIHDQMVSHPLCKKYFAQLGVINFFSHYFMTLKKHRKIPILPKVDLQSAEAPFLFPSLPILSFRKETLKGNVSTIMRQLLMQNKNAIKTFLKKSISRSQLESLQEAVKNIIYAEIRNQATPRLKYEIDHNQEKFHAISVKIARENNLLESLQTIIDAYLAKLPGKLSPGEINKVIDQIIDENLLLDAVKDKTIDFLSLPLPEFLLPGEQSDHELELGKKVVGGCGLNLTPQKAENTPISQSISDYVFKFMDHIPEENWKLIKSENPQDPRGAIFSLDFVEMPLGFENPYEDLETLFTQVQNNSSQIKKLTWLMEQGKHEDFIEILGDLKTPLTELVDNDGKTLLHIAATLEDEFFAKELWKREWKLILQKDSNGYLPSHYAAMHNRCNQLELFKSSSSKILWAISNHGATPLIVAIQSGHFQVIEFLIQQGALGDERLVDGYSTIHCAAHQGNEKNLRLLLEKAPNAKNLIDSTTCEGITPLMIATQRGDESIVKYLISQGALPQRTNKKGVSSLEMAVKNNDLTLCKILIPHSILNPTTIETALRKSSLEINKLLLQMPNYISYRNAIDDTPLLMAIRYANLDFARLILDKCSIPSALINEKNKWKDTALTLSLKGKFYAFAEFLMAKGASINSFDLFKYLLESNYHSENEALNARLNQEQFTSKQLEDLTWIAAKAGNHMGIYKLLIPKGIKIEELKKDNEQPLLYYLAKSNGIFLFKHLFTQTSQPRTLEWAYVAGKHGSLSILKHLLEKLKGQSQTYEGQHLFCTVLERGDIDGIDLFNRSLIHTPMDEKGRLPIHIVAKMGHLNCIKHLYDLGANLCAKDKQGLSPLDYAIEGKNQECINFILAKIPVPILTAESLYLASAFDEEEVLKKLCSSGVSREIISSAFSLAIEKNIWTAFTRLLKAGASLDTSPERSPLLLASSHGRLDMLKIILSLKKQSELETIDGKNALDLAVSRGHEHCVELLVQRGMTTTLRENSLGVLAMLGIQDKKAIYQNLSKMLYKAIKEKDFSSIEKNLNQWDINSYFSFNFDGTFIRMTLLQAVIISSITPDQNLQLIKKIIEQSNINIYLSDENGNSYAHLLMSQEIDPSQFLRLKPIFGRLNDQGESVLHIAAKKGLAEHLTNLLEQLHSKINERDHLGRTPLFYAVINNMPKNVKILIEKGAHLEVRDIHQQTPLTLACVKGNYPIVRRLIKMGANIQGSSKDDQLSPLAISIAMKEKNITSFLLFNGAKCSQQIAHEAARSGQTFILRFLKEQGASLTSVDKNGFQPIHLAAAKGKMGALEFLFDQVPVDTPVIALSTKESQENSLIGATPLHMAATSATVEAVRWLISHGAKVDATTQKGHKLLQLALQNKSTTASGLIELFKNYLFSNDMQQIIPAVLTAIAKDYVEPLKLLLDIGIPVNSKLEHELTSLHYACMCGSLNVTAFLIQHGVDLFILTPEGKTYLELAAANKSPAQFKFLVENFLLDPNIKNQRGESLLHIAASEGNLSHVAILLRHGIDFDLQDSQGQTALFRAAERGHKDIVSLLLLVGADPELKTHFSGKKPEEIANQEMSLLIQSIRNLRAKAPANSSPLHIAVLAKNPLAVLLLSEFFDKDEKNQANKSALDYASPEIQKLLRK